MSRVYTNPQSARVALVLLMFGSISGFVLGQEAHHSDTPKAHIATVVTAHATGSLGAGNVAVSHVV
ncbi:MAG: hypothetical protein ACRDHP_05195, partial [Ktedonobacterales bacterium]